MLTTRVRARVREAKSEMPINTKNAFFAVTKTIILN